MEQTTEQLDKELEEVNRKLATLEDKPDEIGKFHAMLEHTMLKQTSQDKAIQQVRNEEKGISKIIIKEPEEPWTQEEERPDNGNDIQYSKNKNQKDFDPDIDLLNPIYEDEGFKKILKKYKITEDQAHRLMTQEEAELFMRLVNNSMHKKHLRHKLNKKLQTMLMTIIIENIIDKSNKKEYDFIEKLIARTDLYLQYKKGRIKPEQIGETQ